MYPLDRDRIPPVDLTPRRRKHRDSAIALVFFLSLLVIWYLNEAILHFDLPWVPSPQTVVLEHRILAFVVFVLILLWWVVEVCFAGGDSNKR